MVAVIRIREDAPPQDVALKLCLVVGFRGDQHHAEGSGIVISDGLVLTARHVLEAIHQKLCLTPIRFGMNPMDYCIRVVTIGDNRVWVVRGWTLCPFSDLAVLHINPIAGSEDMPRFGRLLMNFELPVAGQAVTVWGLANQRIRVNEDGSVDAGGNPFKSVGLVTDVHPFGRDGFLMTWPVAAAEAHLKGSMSGGPVFNEQGQLCGVATLGHETADENQNPLMYYSLLWPLLPLHLSFPREDLPRETTYSFRNLIENQFVAAVGWDQEWLSFEGDSWYRLMSYLHGELQ